MNTKILLCDDGPAMITVLTAALQKHGYKVVSASKPSECMDAMDNGPYAAIIMDSCICSKSYNTGPMIKRANRLKATTIIIAASSSRVIRGKMMEAGCTHNRDSDDKTGVGQLLLRLVPLPKD